MYKFKRKKNPTKPIENEIILCFPVFNCPFLPRNLVLVTKRHPPPSSLPVNRKNKEWLRCVWLRGDEEAAAPAAAGTLHSLYSRGSFLCSTKRREIIFVRSAGALTVWRNWIMPRQERGAALRGRRLPAGRRETRHRWRLQAGETRARPGQTTGNASFNAGFLIWMGSDNRKPSIDPRNSVNELNFLRKLKVRGLKTAKVLIGRNVDNYVAIKDGKKWIRSNSAPLFSSCIGAVKESAVVWAPTRVQVSECILTLTLAWFGDFYFRFRMISKSDFTLMIVAFQTQTNLV